MENWSIKLRFPELNSVSEFKPLRRDCLEPWPRRCRPRQLRCHCRRLSGIAGKNGICKSSV